MSKNPCQVLVIDGQGGRIGRQLVEALAARSEIQVTAVGTNSAATASMLKGGAKRAATGENAVAVASKRADVIIGPVGIVIADAMLGEITPLMAVSVGQSPAKKILIPVDKCDNIVAGVKGGSLGELINEAIDLVLQAAASQSC